MSRRESTPQEIGATSGIPIAVLKTLALAATFTAGASGKVAHTLAIEPHEPKERPAMLRTLLMLALISPIASAQDFSLPDLPYPTEALQPQIDAETMRIHHGRHHQSYVNNLNAEVLKDERLQGMTIEQILRGVSEYSTGVRNNAGGHYNHSLFWQVMAPTGQGGEPSKALLAELEKGYGSLDAFKRQFETTALSLFGSGWAWLIRTDTGELVISATPNQDNPLMDMVSPSGEPLLALDVWEHAYYLQYRNVRAEYVRGWWPLVNWNEVNRRFAESAN